MSETDSSNWFQIVENLMRKFRDLRPELMTQVRIFTHDSFCPELRDESILKRKEQIYPESRKNDIFRNGKSTKHPNSFKLHYHVDMEICLYTRPSEYLKSK
jgi:hypothetical protein